MPTLPLSDELAQQAADAYVEAGTKAGAARLLDIPQGTFNNRFRKAVLRGLIGTKPVLPNFNITKTTAVTDEHGNVVREFIQQKPETGPEFEVPEGHAVKGVSALLDGQGNLVQQWLKTKTGVRSPEQIAQDFEKAFENFKPAAPYVAKAKDSDSDLLTVYPLCDWHIGLRADADATDGDDWDLSKAQTELVKYAREVIEHSRSSKQALVLGLGDLFHVDSSHNSTFKGTSQDVSGSYPEMIDMGADIFAELSEDWARKHEQVELVFKYGNHDRDSTIGLASALRMYWRNSDRVTVDRSRDVFYYRNFGVNLIGGTHGHTIKKDKLPMLMANYRPEYWATSLTRHWHTGHDHTDKLYDEDGVRVYTHSAPIPKGEWNHGMGYISGRSMKSCTYHAELGYRGLAEIEIL